MKSLVERPDGKTIYSSGCPAEDARSLASLVREGAITLEGAAAWLEYIAELVDEERAKFLNAHYALLCAQ